MNLAQQKKAKREFLKAFNQYAVLMYDYNGAVHEQPELYYSKKRAEEGLPQSQTKYYLKETEKVKERIAKAKISFDKNFNTIQGRSKA